MIAGSPALFAAPATAQAIVRARAVAVLVGSYDGSGNYGDILQLDAALELLERLGPGLLVLPVVEREHLAAHRALAEHALHPPAHAVFFDAGAGGDDGLMPVAAPVELAFAACYLYGGGYLNSSWGERKLAMLRAADALLVAGGAEQVCRVSSGLQVDADWIAGLGEEDAEALRAFELLGVRDPRSGSAFAALGSSARVLETADDAVGVLCDRSTPEIAPIASAKLHVNLQFAEHEWVTAEPEKLLDFYVALLDELGRLAGSPLVAHPLIAYLDRRISERPAVVRLTEACSERGIEVGEPRVLRPAALAEAVPALRRAAVTVSCSYHVALTSLLLGIPTVVIRDNAYYEQKAAGLSDAFGLPEAFSVAAISDPQAVARGVASVVLDDERGADLHRQLAAGARELRRRRAGAETELLGRLGAAAMLALTDRIDELANRLRERSAEPAELLAQLALLRTDHEELVRTASTPGLRLDAGTAVEESRAGAAAERDATAAETARRLDAEQRATEAEARCAATEELLSVIVASRSWTMTRPLRTGASRLRRKPGG